MNTIDAECCEKRATTYALIFLILLYIACEQLKYSNLFDVAHGLCQKLLQNTKRYWGQKIAQLHTDHQSHSLSSTVVVSYKYWNRNMKPLFRLLKHNVLKDNNAELTQIHYYEQFRANVKENFSVESVISKECKTSTKYFCKFGWHTLSHDLLYKITLVLINALRTQKVIKICKR